MAGFFEAKPEQAYLKAGIMGFSGSGKTFTAKELAIGLHLHCQQKKVMQPETPVFFLDTETGSSWVQEYFAGENIKLLVDKTRLFTRLVPAIREVSKTHGILIIDSITHFWREITESYAKKKGRTSLTFQDWAWIKSQWGLFTDEFVNSPCHIIMCGRAGFEYDFFEAADGKKELEKTGIKMKAEGETGYEPSILVLMEAHQQLDQGGIKNVYREAHIIKDRGNRIDGKVFRNPTFKDFLPHIQCLNLGGEHVGVITDETSESIVPPNRPEWKAIADEKEVVLDEIQCYLIKVHPSTKTADKQAKMALLEKHFGTASWERVKTLKLHELRNGLDAMRGPSPVDPLTQAASEVF